MVRMDFLCLKNIIGDMNIAYVNIWSGFDQNGYPQKCLFTKLLREIDPNLQVDVGIDAKKHYDLVLSMFSPIIGSSTYTDMSRVTHKSLCFTGESYDIMSTTPYCGAYIGFDHAKDIPIPLGVKYLRFPLYAIYHQEYMHNHGCSSYEELRAKFKKATYEKKYSAVVSNANNQLRTEVIRILVSMGLCNSAGAVHNNIRQIGWASNSKIEFSSQSMYGMAFENRSKIGYITEKIYECFISGTVPYYWGASDIIEEFNPKSYHIFDGSNEQTANQSLKHMIEALSNDDIRRSMIDVDPFTGFRSEIYIKDGKRIIKDFIMNYIETK